MLSFNAFEVEFWMPVQNIDKYDCYNLLNSSLFHLRDDKNVDIISKNSVIKQIAENDFTCLPKKRFVHKKIPNCWSIDHLYLKKKK